MTTPVTVAYTTEYLDWRLGEDHPTNPERARLAVEQITTWAASARVDLRRRVPKLNWDRGLAEASTVHSPTYVAEVHAGRCQDWSGTQERLGEVAALMFTGTVDLVEELETADKPAIYFNPQGAKHHAHRDHSSGFCVLNDMAWAATRLTSLNKKVVYVDWDAHHGDGVEALLLHNANAVTASIHDGTIFPGTGRAGHDASRGAYNWALARAAGDDALRSALHEIIELIDQETPDVILLACGADGLSGDQLSTLNYTLGGIADVATTLGQCCARKRIPIVVGGAGGYQPLTETPQAWATTIRCLHETFLSVPHT